MPDDEEVVSDDDVDHDDVNADGNDDGNADNVDDVDGDTGILDDVVSRQYRGGACFNKPTVPRQLFC